jgi:hypothetical protein
MTEIKSSEDTHVRTYTDIVIDETFKVADYINQQPRPVQYSHIAPCLKCAQRASTRAAQLCWMCNGVGHMARLALFAQQQQPTQVAETYSLCRQCHGRSILVTSEATAESTETKHELSNEENVGECSECRGFEIVYKTTTAFITVPPGSVNELGQSRVFLQGAGHSQPGACPPGNVIVNFAVAASAAASKAKVPVQDTAQATPASAATIDWIRGHVNMKLLVSPDDASAGGRGESKWQRTITAPDGVTRLAVQGQGTELVEFGKHGVWAFDQVLASESAGASGSAALVASNGKQVGASRKAPTRGHLRVIPELDS